MTQEKATIIVYIVCYFIMFYIVYKFYKLSKK